MSASQAAGGQAMLGPVTVSDVILALSGLAAAVTWWQRRKRRKERERERFELRDQALMGMCGALAQALRLMSGRPCMLGTGGCDSDSSADVKAQQQVAVLIDRLDSLHERMAELMERGGR